MKARRKRRRRRSAGVEAIDFTCEACGQRTTLFVDPFGGQHQSYVEDCQVCCRPSAITVHVDPESGEVAVDARCDR
jgi:hypothetical protein